MTTEQFQTAFDAFPAHVGEPVVMARDPGVVEVFLKSSDPTNCRRVLFTLWTGGRVGVYFRDGMDMRRVWTVDCESVLRERMGKAAAWLKGSDE